MNSTGLLDYWRSQVVDKLRPYLWSDDDAFVYMNEAQLEFCRLTQGIADATSTDVCTIPVATGEITAECHPAILTFRNASLASTGSNIDIKNHTEVKRWTNQAGNITQMIVGLERNLVRWNYAPTVDDEVNVLVYRLPLTDITGVEQDFEIESMHHASLAFWMEHLCFLKHDTETYDKARSDKAKAEFEAYCARVKTEQDRYKHAPQPIAYGGI